MVLRNLEERLERAVEGLFAKVFRSGLQPIEVSRRLIKEFDANLTRDARGQLIGPNRFEVQLASDDHERFAAVNQSLSREFAMSVRQHASSEHIRFLGPVQVALVDADELTIGRCRVESAFDESSDLAAPHAYVELPDGERLHLTEDVTSVGRSSECILVLADPNASRHHADLRAEGDTYRLIDRGSTNGTQVNGVKIASQLLSDGDELTFATITVRFRLI